MTTHAFTCRLIHPRLFVAAVVATTLLLSHGGTKATAAEAGQLDPTFGNGGKMVGFGMSGVSAMVLQPDGKIVLAGTFASWISMEFAVMRFLPDGTPDATFGTGFYGSPGQVETDFSGRDDYATSLVLLPDGTIVVGGAADCSSYGQYDCGFGLVWYSPDGTELGKVTTFFDTSVGVNSLALQNGKIVAAGGPYLARYDGSFLEGTVTTNMAQILTVVVQPDGTPDGKLVAAGWCPNDLGSCMARFGPDGSLDTSFGADGWVTDLGETVFRALTLQPDGSLVVACDGRSRDFVLVRYKPDGSLDNSFGTNGKVTTDFGNADAVSAVALQPDGKIIAAGTAATPATTHFALARYDSGGSLDETFGSFGKVTTDFDYPNYTEWAATAVVVQPDGKLIEAGLGEWPAVVGGTISAMARYLPGAGQQSPLALLRVAPASVIGGDAAKGTVTLAAAQTSNVIIELSTSDTALATVPPSVIVPAGLTSETFVVSTNPIFTTTGVEIRASLGDATRYASLLLYAQTSVRSVLVDPSVVGGTPAAGMLYLTRAPGSAEAIEVTLSSSDPAVAAVPLSVTIPGDAASAAFTINTAVVDTATAVRVSATYGTTADAVITVNPPPPLLESLTLNPLRVTAGTLSAATVTLTSGAPAGGASVSVFSIQQPAGFAVLPSSMTIPEDGRSVTFIVMTFRCRPGSATISATYAGTMKSAMLTANTTPDIVAIKRARYQTRQRTLTVDASSTDSNATLDAYTSAGGQVGVHIGTLTNLGGGSYHGEFSWPVYPPTIIVTSSSCGSATKTITDSSAK